jgi:hypothetical protein
MRLQHLVDLFQHLGDAQVRGLGQGAEKSRQKRSSTSFQSRVAGRDVVELPSRSAVKS